jgi:hypothetical protein
MSDLPFDMPPVSAGFDPRAGWVVNRLMGDLAPLAVNHAGGIVGNLGGESGLTAINERHPLVPGSRGGFGWGQWTGPRRRNFEHFCADHDLAITSDEANYRFLVWELRDGDQKHALEQLRKTTAIDAATYTFEAYYERPADLQRGLADRIAFAHRAIAAAVGLPVPAAPVLPDSAVSPADALNRQELDRITAPAKPKMSGPHGALVGSGASVMLAQTLIYLSHWPLQPLDDNTAMAIAGLIISVVGLAGHQLGRRAAATTPEDKS